MKKYLFLILDRYESSLSKTIFFESDLTPKAAFKFAVLENYAGRDALGEEWFKGEIANEICTKRNLVTHDMEEVSFLLIKL